MQRVIERFRPFFEANDIRLVVPDVRERLEEHELLPLVADVHGVICGDDRFTARVLEAAGALEVISKWGTGIDSIDQARCQELGIVVRNTPNAFSEPVADSVLGYVLCFARRLPWMSEEVHAGRWHKLPGRALRECTLGVIGVGTVGQAVLRRAQGVGMTLLGHDVRPVDPAFAAQLELRMLPLDELLSRADFITLHCDLNPPSRHLSDARALSRVKASAVLINTARGAVVDEPALEAALIQRRLAGAALDTFELEPRPATSPLRRLPQVMLAPHNANSSPAAWEAVHRSSIDNLIVELARAFPERGLRPLADE
jgi:D-3-phosphoglycerate dehydrogenase